MRREGDILSFLKCLRVDECETTLSDRADFGEVCVRSLERYMEDDWVLRKLVEVRYGRKEDRGRRSDRDQSASFEW
jgi:hypothetical protein